MATRSALMGARGNSGVILSQIVRGFAESLGAEPAAIDGRAVARAAARRLATARTTPSASRSRGRC